jgi:hypothetical protein
MSLSEQASHLKCGKDNGPRTHPEEKALLACEPASEGEGFLLPLRANFVNDGKVEVGGDEPGPHPLKIVGPPISPGNDWRASGLNGDNSHRRILFLEESSNTGNRPTRA